MESKVEQEIILCDDGLAQLKEKLKGHETLHSYSVILDDLFLTGFLQGKKGDVDKAVQCLECYIKMRTVKYKRFIHNYCPSHLPLLDTGVVNVLQGRDPHDRVVLHFQINKWIPSDFSFDTLIASFLFIMDEGIRSYFSKNSEVVAIVDCSGFCFAQARTMTPSNMILLIDLFMKAIPTRPKGFHLVNYSYLIHYLFKIIKPLLEKKIAERVHFHGSYEELHQFIPANILPASLGGDLSIEESRDVSLYDVIRQNDEFYEELRR